MKKYRRIEITAFRRRVSYISGEPTADAQAYQDVSINDAETQKAIEVESEEGQSLLSDAVQRLEERRGNQTREGIFTKKAPEEPDLPTKL
jgi:hypothetical protein